VSFWKVLGFFFLGARSSATRDDIFRALWAPGSLISTPSGGGEELVLQG
jgi:hypothetical protein